ncbi:MAG: LysR substrate-binding domain-containing protein [Terracidiphilus sp.]
MDFRLRQLHCFIVLSDTLNYGKAARALYLSQPTLSFQIKSLEDSLGVKLFDRSRQHVSLTDAGYAFRDYAKSMLATAHAAKERLSRLASRLSLRVCCGPVGQYVVLPELIRSLARIHPEFQLELMELTTEQQIAGLPEGKIDALLMAPELPILGMRFEPICSEPLIALVSRQNPLANKRVLSIRELNGVGIIASRPRDCRFHQQFLHTLFAPYGITPRIVEAPYSCAVQLAYAAADEGVAIMPSSMARCPFPDLVALRFEESLPELQMGLAWMESNDSLALQILRQIVSRNSKAHLQAGNQTWSDVRQQPVVVMRNKSKLPIGEVSGFA